MSESMNRNIPKW